VSAADGRIPEHLFCRSRGLVVLRPTHETAVEMIFAIYFTSVRETQPRLEALLPSLATRTVTSHNNNNKSPNPDSHLFFHGPKSRQK
jgi:hypothetical protein